MKPRYAGKERLSVDSLGFHGGVEADVCQRHNTPVTKTQKKSDQNNSGLKYTYNIVAAVQKLFEIRVSKGTYNNSVEYILQYPIQDLGATRT